MIPLTITMSSYHDHNHVALLCDTLDLDYSGPAGAGPHTDTASAQCAGGGCQAGANTMKIGWDIPQRAAVLTRRQHAATALRGAWGCSADTAG